RAYPQLLRGWRLRLLRSMLWPKLKKKSSIMKNLRLKAKMIKMSVNRLATLLS
ncbi:hypothetical protein KI387_029651, partial [Taxus chinensis]